MGKTRVAVLRGGPSEEYEISLQTGSAVLQGLNTDMFEPIDVVITKNGEWLIDGHERYPEKILSTVDVAFLALHGTYGEDGTVQRLLDRYGVRYTGSPAYASSIAFHKVIAKDHVRERGVKMAPHMVVTQESLTNLYGVVHSITQMFGPQYVIKPVASGSSIGTKVVKDGLLLQQALEDSLGTFDEVIVEARIKGKEATCGVVENFRGQTLYALPPIEIVPPSSFDFFDYQVKYDGSTEEICPGRFPRTVSRDIERIAKLVHEILGLRGYSRSDFMVQGGDVYFLEINTLPGLTPESLFPKAIQAVGGTYGDFLTHLLTEAIERK